MINKNAIFSIFGFFIILGVFLIIKINYNQVDNKKRGAVSLNISSIAKSLQCQRKNQRLESVDIDPKLSSEAQHILDILAHDLNTRPEPLLDAQPWWHLSTLQESAQSDPCGWNLDLNVAEMKGITAIGIGFLPAVEYAPATVLILGRK